MLVRVRRWTAKMGYDHIFAGERLALNISGINHGSNSAVSILTPTMGAAMKRVYGPHPWAFR
ncbi:MAG: 5'/3'-nucleotidase SurE [Alistipes inops]